MAPRAGPSTIGRLGAVALAVALPPAVAIALVPVRGQTPNATVALLLAAVVTLLASTGTRTTAAIAAVAAGAAFDVFHTRPYGSLVITRSEDVQATALLLLVGLIVGQLAVVNRRHRHLEAEARVDLGRIHGVAEMVAAGEPVDQIVQAVANEIGDLLALERCRYEESFGERPGPFIERHGDVTWGAFRWGFRTMGLPGREVSVMVEHNGRPLGRYVLLGRPGARVTEDQLLAVVALADQAGAALAANSTLQ